MKNFLILSLFVICISCTKKNLPLASILPPVTKTISIAIDAKNIIRNLTGVEVGINLNYLMDDAVLPGQTFATTIYAISKMGTNFLRYPGGEKSDNYLFAKSPYTLASPYAAYCDYLAKDSRFFNSDLSAKAAVLDFDEYMEVCRQTGATPLVVVAYDAMYSTSKCGTIPTRAELLANAKEWVRYANIVKGYHIKHWMIGNESWNSSDNQGTITPANYAIDIAAFADTMRTIDPSIKIIANGKSEWWQTLLQSSAVSKIDFLAASNYLPDGFTGYDYFRSFTGDLNSEITAAVSAINNFASASDKQRIGVIISEYNAIDFYNRGWTNINNMGHALANFQMLGDALLQPKLFASCLWNTRWITNLEKPDILYDAINANGEANAIGKGLAIFGNNLLNNMVVATSENQLISPYVTCNIATAKMNIFLVNKDKVPQPVSVSILNYSNTNGEVWVLKGTGDTDTNPLWTKLSDITVTNNAVSLNLDAVSITMLKFN